MRILWKYLKPHRALITLSLLLAKGVQLLNLLEPVIFGKIIDRYATNKYHLSEHDLINGVIYWLLIALGIAVVARLCKAAQEYTTRKAVARFGMHIFNDGLKQTLRLSFQEFEESRSGTTLAVLQKVKTDAERLIYSLALPKLYTLLARCEQGMIVFVAGAIYQINRDVGMIETVLTTLPTISNEFALIVVLYYLRLFDDQRIKAALKKYRHDRRYLVACNAASSLGNSGTKSFPESII